MRLSLVSILLLGCGGGELLSDYALTLVPRTLDGQDPFAGAATVKLWVQPPGAEPELFFLGDARGNLELSEQPPLQAGTTLGLVVEQGGVDDGAWDPARLQAWGRTILEVGLETEGGSVGGEVVVPMSYELGALGSLSSNRTTFHGAAAMLPGGDVLLFGGTKDADRSGEEKRTIQRLRDSDTGDWALEVLDAKLPDALAGLSASTVVVDGEPLVVLAGGAPMSNRGFNFEQLSTWLGVFDPMTEEWVVDRPKGLGEGLAGHQALVMANGRVLLVGRAPMLVNEDAPYLLFDPDTNKVVTEGIIDGVGAFGLVASSNGLDGALICGGARSAVGDFDFSQPIEVSQSCVRMDLQGTISSAADLPVPMVHGDLVELGGGSLLLTGGVTSSLLSYEALPASEEAWLYENEKWSSLPYLKNARARHDAVVLPDGGALLVGGVSTSGILYDYPSGPVRCAERFDPVTERFVDLGCSDVGAGARPTLASWPGEGAFALEGVHFESQEDEGGRAYGLVGLGPVND